MTTIVVVIVVGAFIHIRNTAIRAEVAQIHICRHSTPPPSHLLGLPPLIICLLLFWLTSSTVAVSLNDFASVNLCMMLSEPSSSTPASVVSSLPSCLCLKLKSIVRGIQPSPSSLGHCHRPPCSSTLCTLCSPSPLQSCFPPSPPPALPSSSVVPTGRRPAAAADDEARHRRSR